MNIAISSDHRGFQAKENLRTYLESKGIRVVDYGCKDANSCDYPDTAIPAALAVARAECDRGILMCGTGIGMSITANKVHGIRAALCHDELTAELSRRHNNSNVLCLPADLIGQALIRRVVDVWIKTEFEGGRHERRVTKITEFENNGCRTAGSGSESAGE